jgi:hypothetical protein
LGVGIHNDRRGSIRNGKHGGYRQHLPFEAGNRIDVLILIGDATTPGNAATDALEGGSTDSSYPRAQLLPVDLCLQGVLGTKRIIPPWVISKGGLIERGRDLDGKKEMTLCLSIRFHDLKR